MLHNVNTQERESYKTRYIGPSELPVAGDSGHGYGCGALDRRIISRLSGVKALPSNHANAKFHKLSRTGR
jgi:hypothetical protein